MPLVDHFATEKQFLIGLAIGQFNRQYNKNFHINECDIKSIPPRPFTDRGYEINTLRLDDMVRLHMYVTFGGTRTMGEYTLEVYAPYENMSLSDETYVTYMGIDRYYIDNGIYKFRELIDDVTLVPIILLESSGALLLESGGFIELENALG